MQMDAESDRRRVDRPRRDSRRESPSTLAHAGSMEFDEEAPALRSVGGAGEAMVYRRIAA
jgi:hypothetical protein